MSGPVIHVDQVTRGHNQVRRNSSPDRPARFELLDREWDLLPEVFAPVYCPSTEHWATALPFPVGGRFLEIGSGTGVVAVTAALRGCAEVVALDISPAAVANTRRNAERHGVASRMYVLTSDLFSALPADERFDLVFWGSNCILAPPGDGDGSPLGRAVFDPGYVDHRAFVAGAAARLRPGGRIMLGFVSLGDHELLTEIAAEHGLRVQLLTTSPHPTIAEVEYSLLELVPIERGVSVSSVDERRAESGDGGYRSGFVRWDERSWVRAKPRRESQFEPGKHFFSPDLSALLVHPQVRRASQAVREAILVHNLYIYLEFTVRLEMGPVNETCAMLRSPDFLSWLPPGMKADALRIYTDEAGHAEMSNTLLEAVRDETGIVPIDHEPAFLRDLRGLYADEPPVYRPLLKMFFTIVSETLITGSLTKLPKDLSVQQAVRDVAQDHATDEGLHHAYFRRLFDMLWPRLPAPLRRKVGMLLPAITRAFLWPDEAALRAVLHDVRFPDSDRVVAETVALPEVRAGVAENAAPTMRMLRRAGVFEDPAVCAAFHAHDLPPDLAGRS